MTSVESSESPLRAELFGLSQLEAHAKSLADSHELGSAGPRTALLERLTANQTALSEAYALVADAVARGRQITPAAEWFVDNYHLIEEHIRLARRHLPPNYSRALPYLVDRTPRVYLLALELIAHSHGHVDVDVLRAYIAAYQTQHPLRLGELWAIPIMLRLALIENLRRVIAAVTSGRLEREAAARWADALLEGAAGHPSHVVGTLARLVEANPPLTVPFVAELASRLQGQGNITILPMAWLEQRLELEGKTVEAVFQTASQSQASDQISVGNSITSLRTLDAIDWRAFVEELAVVETVLRGDPAKVYATMEFATRDRYRHVVERLAKRGKLSEREVAVKAIELAAAQPPGREHHVGYFLIDRGRSVLELAVAGRPYDRALARTAQRGLGFVVYVGIIALITFATTALVNDLTLGRHHPFVWNIVWSIAIALVSSQLAITLVHWIATLAIKPRSLPRLDFSEGIPAESRTLVAVPVMLTSEAGIDHLVELLEVRFLANRDPQLGFALITDFADAEAEHNDSDARLLAHARTLIEELNEKYSDPKLCGGFFLFHRTRKFNSRDQVWMGWERKRGKLEELNAALRGELDRFAEIVGPTERFAATRYVIVLDSDTGLPRDAARELVGTMAHPLNRPVVDKARGRVCHGYAILQPRVGITLASAHLTRFAQLFAGEPGIDPYTRAVSDIYQDLFAEGSFIGKGIYDVDAVRAVLEGILPDNRVLSHDLLEGAYGRAGLVSDVIVFEDYPSTYAVDASRRARWIRGDWQIARWLLWHVPAGSSRQSRNPISALSRWKILDNLRRSMVPLAMIAMLAIGWTIPGVVPLALPLVLATFLVPPLLAAFTELQRRPKEIAVDEHARVVRRQLGHAVLREGFSFACLPEDAAISLGAIARVWFRLWVTKRKLLEWKTAAEAERTQRTSFTAAYASMWIAPGAALAIGVELALGHVAAPWLAVPIAVIWAATPAFVWWTSRPIRATRVDLSRTDTIFLHRLARKTWRFFRTYVTPEDNDLPPDNFQEDPPVGIAHRTSPTNIGVSLLANLAAHDFGYATLTEVIERTTRTFATLDKLQRFRGHFYNWYDTRSLEPLRPMYVSSVDSGNLAGHLLTLAEGLAELVRCPIVGKRWLLGVADTLELAGIKSGELVELTRTTPRTLAEARTAVTKLVAAARALTPEDGERAWWRTELQRQLDELAAELAALAPWFELAPDLVDGLPSLERIARLDNANPAVEQGAEHAAHLIGELRKLEQHARELADFDYDFLYDSNRHLLAIGYSVTDHRLDNSFYDLLASEARLASFVAIAQNKIPQEHWFHLGRRVTTTDGMPTLLSWSGSMFEYLMPLLV
ncbi:MAG: glycosyltransferase family 2 protein, partial [Kofleriaceae bacterium]